MKGSKVLFAVCLALLGFGSVLASESDDAVRAAVRRGETNTVTNTRKKSETPNTLSNTAATTRITGATTKQNQPQRERKTTPRTGTNVSTVSRTSATPKTKQTSARTTASTAQRTSTVSRTAMTSNAGHAATQSRTATRTQTSVRTPQSLPQNASRQNSSARSAVIQNNTVQNLRSAIMDTNAKECRQVYYDCMDEFCANKDSQLKRCACSSRLHEFDSVKKQLETAEEKMLDFSQRLLTVSMDAEDAAVLNIATEGELAFNQTDTSKSKKLLDEITNKLNTTFNDDSFGIGLSAISLSLDEDAAFDTVDSLMGASTTLKTGTALYSAALPVCREMAAEICSPEQLSIAESGYQMMIEQDCNTVKKSYQAQVDVAHAKVLENSALLDMSRLNTHQDQNSDDILTCKRKMLDMLSNTSVCGTNLTRCLDMTGQYIDPSTGEAFLTVNLANLSRLINRPTANNTWTDMPGNDAFVQHLNSKKKFLEPAMEHCQNIADTVWEEFLEDALAQIKLAQNAKLEEIRQSCTTLTTQCLSNAATSLEEFDARALSTFGVVADKTVNEMCTDIKNACTALMQTTDDLQDSWSDGMTEIATDTTYDTIIKTCREVGRACIIQSCKSISGNFGLCENIETSVNRKSIVSGTSCWQEVLDCVADAGGDSIDNIIEQLASRNVIPQPDNSNNVSGTTPTYSFYSELYDITSGGKLYPAHSNSSNSSSWNRDGCMLGSTENNDYLRCVYDMCSAKNECTSGTDTTTKCKTCRIAERIWGHCELSPSTNLISTDAHNMILKPSGDETTLLYWFALNTGTNGLADSCRNTACGPGERIGIDGACHTHTDFASDGEICAQNLRINTSGNEQNCCTNGQKDSWGNCCDYDTGTLATIKYSNDEGYYTSNTAAASDINICIPKGKTVEYVLTFATTDTSDTYHIQASPKNNMLVCLGNIDKNATGTTADAFPSGNTLTCSDKYLIITTTGIYYEPIAAQASSYLKQSYKTDDGATICTLQYSNGAWTWNQQTSATTATPCSDFQSDPEARHHITYVTSK